MPLFSCVGADASCFSHWSVGTIFLAHEKELKLKSSQVSGFVRSSCFYALAKPCDLSWSGCGPDGRVFLFRTFVSSHRVRKGHQKLSGFVPIYHLSSSFWAESLITCPHQEAKCCLVINLVHCSNETEIFSKKIEPPSLYFSQDFPSKFPHVSWFSEHSFTSSLSLQEPQSGPWINSSIWKEKTHM